MDSSIKVFGAREHNLKNIDVEIPRNKLVVLTGLSGSGKSSLAFDTIYAEGQRRYVESLSAYARMFLGQMQKPDVDKIEGLSPAIAIDQKTTSRNPRSTVGTVTEIYDYLRLLYARVGEVHCPNCGKIIEQQSVEQILERIMSLEPESRLLVLAPVVRGRKGEFSKQLEQYRKDGFARVRIDGEIIELDYLDELQKLEKQKKHNIEIVVDRLLLKEEIRSRLTDSLELALNLASGLVALSCQAPGSAEPQYYLFSQKFSCPDCNIDIGEISPRLFSFNNPFGACPHCLGLGEVSEIDPETLIFDANLSLDEGAIQAGGWNFADKTSWARSFVEALAKRYSFSLSEAWTQLPARIKQIILYGNDGEILDIDTSNSKYNRGEKYSSAWIGVVNSLDKRYHETSSDDMREYYQKFYSVKPCPLCQGARLKKEALAVTIGGLNIHELCLLPVKQAHDFLQQLSWNNYHKQVAQAIMLELEKRLTFLLDVGLDYLNLARSASTLSGGEAQRIRLATQIGSGLMGVIYILDEPSIGLHQRDNGRLLQTLYKLRNLGNTVLVVEHDEETILAADYVVDIGPKAGAAGGELVAAGKPASILTVPASITGQYLAGKLRIPVPRQRRLAGKEYLRFFDCCANNLKNINVAIPLGLLTLVTGVSGSGKSSLVNGIIYKRLAQELNGQRKTATACGRVEGYESLEKVVVIDQSPIGRTPRSNPATYTGLFDVVRKLFSATREAKARGYQPGRFSFNVKGGRCEACSGDGVKCIEMHFLPDVYVECELCHGKRYNRETLEVRYKDKNIAEVLELTVDQALLFFANVPLIERKLQTLQDVGLGYIKLGQPSTQLSGGEAQRVKLATELSRRQSGHSIYILDEPTSGLHAADVHRLVDILQRLTDNGNTVLVIEHNLDVIKVADYVIDLGPEGGAAGGQMVACGTPEEIIKCKNSYTGVYLKKTLEQAKLFQEKDDK